MTKYPKNNLFQFEAIGIAHTCFKEKFGIPRQSGLVKEAQGVLKLHDHPFFVRSLLELEGFSHLWVVFVFHQHDARNWKPSIRPPRLGGVRRVGVLASRSPHRPNPIGISVVEIEKIKQDAPGGPEIYVKGIDLLDGSPILDIKPYLPYADSIPQAQSGWAEAAISRVPVVFAPLASSLIEVYEARGYPNLKKLITEILELDPRPGFQRRQLPPGSSQAEGTAYGFRLLDFDVKWKILEDHFQVTQLVPSIEELPREVLAEKH